MSITRVALCVWLLIAIITRAEADEAANPRTLMHWREAVSAALREAAQAESAELDSAARRLLALYNELNADQNMTAAQREPLRIKLRTRLERVSQQIARRAIERRRQQPVEIRLPNEMVLAQFPAALLPAQPFDAEEITANALRGAIHSIQPMTWDINGGPGVAVLAQFGGGLTVGGPAAGGFGDGLGQRQQANDYGDELVEVIQRTIAPATWDVNGGPGAIVFFRPRQVLVVRQQGEVHDQLGDLLGQLRRN